jgi:site-specific DNA recombinase
MSTVPPLPAAVYTRQSQGRERSIEEQEAAGRAACDTGGWRVAEVYTDTTSASRFARKERTGWERLLTDLEEGRFAVLVMWESSRGDRDPESWMGLLRRCRERSVLIHVVSHDRTYDVANARDWRTLAEDGVDSAYESEKTSLRLQRAMSANAVRGRPHGVTLYGYERIYDQHTRELEIQREDPRNAPVVREIFARVAGGDPVSRIAEDLNARGTASPKGGRWGRATVRQLVTNPAYIGKRRTGAREKRPELHDAIWPPLVDEATYWAVQRRLTDPARKVTRPGRYKWLLSYLATCAECGAPMSAFRHGTLYGCSEGGCTYINRELTDAYITGSVLGRLGHPETLPRLFRQDDSAVVRARAEAGELRARLDEHARMSARGEISPRALAIAESELEPLIKAAETRALQASVPRPLRDLVAAREHLRADWDALPVAARREIVRLCYTIAVRKPTRKAPAGAIDTDRLIVKARVRVSETRDQ